MGKNLLYYGDNLDVMRRYVKSRHSWAIVLVAIGFASMSLVASGCGDTLESTESTTVTSKAQRVPQVLLLPLEWARTIATRSGLDIAVDEAPRFDVEPGVVVAQEPEPGFMTFDGRLRVTVSTKPIPVPFFLIDDWDPEGDQRENPEQLTNLIDEDLTTTWSTELYESPDFSGTGKTGVGLVFSLKHPATIVKLTGTIAGWSGEVQAVAADGAMVTLAQLAGDEATTLSREVTSCLIWFTRLARVPGSDLYGVEIAEVAFY